MTNYYVYYKVKESDLKALRPSIEKLFKKIQTETGVLGRWMRRRDDPATYMEVYEGVTNEAAFEELLARETKALEIDRRIERFVCA